jgi:hypothetical protein
MWKEAAVECLNAGISLNEMRQGAIIPNYDNWIMGKKSNPQLLQIGKSIANYSNAKFFPILRTMNTGIHILKLAGA